jgi:hypothetical protein
MSQLLIAAMLPHTPSTSSPASPGSQGVGHAASALSHALSSIQSPPPSHLSKELSTWFAESLPDKLAKSSFELKVLISRVSMHLSQQRRKYLFHQIDMINDPEEWEASESFVDTQSFKTFIRFIVCPQLAEPPMLGLSADGLILAGWVSSCGQLSLEFLPHDRINWSLKVGRLDDLELGSGSTRLGRLWDVLSPYQITRLLKNGAQ